MKIPVSVWALFLMLIAGCTNLHEQHLEMLPKELLQDVSENFDASLIKHLDPEKPFSEQDLSEETLEILSEIFKDLEEII